MKRDIIIDEIPLRFERYHYDSLPVCGRNEGLL